MATLKDSDTRILGCSLSNLFTNGFALQLVADLLPVLQKFILCNIPNLDTLWLSSPII